jgi:hypothetical protein
MLCIMARMVRWVAMVVGLFFTVPLAAMLAETFYSALLARLGIDTSQWADPAVNWVAAYVLWAPFQFAAVFFIGVAAGAWGHFFAQRIGPSGKGRVLTGPPSLGGNDPPRLVSRPPLTPVPVEHLDGADYDLIAAEKPLRIRATKTSDYTDVAVDLRFKNRSQHSLWLGKNGVHLSIDGKMPPTPGGTISRPFASGRTEVSAMGTVRLYGSAAGKTGIVVLTIKYGLTEQTARTSVQFKYFFLIKNEPDEFDREQRLEYEIIKDDTSYEFREFEPQKRQSP